MLSLDIKYSTKQLAWNFEEKGHFYEQMYFYFDKSIDLSILIIMVSVFNYLTDLSKLLVYAIKWQLWSTVNVKCNETITIANITWNAAVILILLYTWKVTMWHTKHDDEYLTE